MSRGKVDVKLYEMMKNNECHLFKRNDEVNAYIALYFHQLQDFVEAVGACHFDDGGLKVTMLANYICIDLKDIIEGFGDELENYRDCFDEDEFRDYFK